MLSLLLITALAVQYPQTSKPATQDTAAPAPRRSTTAAPRGTSQSAIARQAFHDRMRELWSDHIVYTRGVIVSVAGGLPDTAEVVQRLLRNQDEIGEAIKPYYGDAGGTQLASLLRNHIQLAAKTLIAAKGTTTAMADMNMQNSSTQYPATRMGDTVSARTDTAKIQGSTQYPANPTAQPRRSQADTTKRNPNARVTGDTLSQRMPSNQVGTVQVGTVRTDTAGQSGVYAQASTQTSQVDSASLNQAIADLKANGDSIAAFLAKANPRGFNQSVLSSALQMHITLLLKEATAQIKKDWSGSIAAFDESQRQAQQMADMLSEGIMKQFPSRFNAKATTVSSR